jgi:protein-S-isoprenylcysteine O-methyltransferase Ste14
MPLYTFIILPAGWVAWMVPFILVRLRQTKQAPTKIDRRARWGIVLVGLSYSVLFQPRLWIADLPIWRTALSVVFFVLASALSWGATRALGRQWRIDAGLNEDHELVMSGPYRLVRHPIYTSMLCMFCATGFLLTPLPILFAGLIVCVIGTEIRVRVEDRLLRERFGDGFRRYQNSVAAYIPFIR